MQKSCGAKVGVTQQETEMLAMSNPTNRPQRRATWLLTATLTYNVAESIVALWSGAKADSIALLGFGLDSVIESVAAGVLLWRLSIEVRGADRTTVARADRSVHRVVGSTFLILAIYVTIQSAVTLWGEQPPGESIVGIVLAGVSLVVMPALAWAKLRVARRIGSAALRAEAKETIACSYLSFTLLLGLSANAVAGWWWADPVAALLMVPWLVKEGREALFDG